MNLVENTRVLIIDDNPENITLLSKLLTDNNFEVFVAINGEKGIERAIQVQPDIILLDTLMPGKDGYEVCTILKSMKETLSIPIIFISALSEAIDKVKAFQAGGSDFMTKPFMAEELLARINTHLSNIKLQQQLQKANEQLEQKVRERNVELILANEDLNLEIEDRKNAETFALRAVKEWEETFDALEDMICIIDTNHTILRANKSMSVFCNSNSMDRLLGRKCYESIHKCGNPLDSCPHQKLLNDNKPHKEEIFDEASGKHFLVSVFPIVNQENKIYASVHAAHDITEQKNTELAIKESEEKFRNIFNSSNDEIIITDFKGIILEINPKASSRFDKSQDQCISANIADMVHISKRQDFLSFFQKIKIIRSGFFETESIKNQGEKSYLEIYAKIIKYKRKEAVLVVSRDITERKIMQQKMISSIIETEEKERSRIARDLHDGIGPLLSTIKLYIQWLSKPDSITEKEDIAAQAESTLDEAINSVREISNNLSPNILTHYGLKTAVESFCKKINNTNGLKINYTIKTPPELKKEIEIMLYRIINESINNTLKYASAKNIDIEVDHVESLLAMVYKDDGKGFPVKEVLASPKGMGLLNMKHRVETMGGNITLWSQPNQGMRISILFNL